MKITRGFNVRGFILAAAFSAGLGFGTSAYAQAVVRSYLVDLNSKAVTDVGDLGGSIDSTRAFGINDAGQVVGTSAAAGGGTHAFITGPNGAGMMDLNSVVDLPAGLILTNASVINNAGQVVAFIPEPEIYALFLAGLALVGFMTWRKRLPV